MARFIIKHVDNRRPQIKMYREEAVKKDEVAEENKKKVNEEVMTTSEKIAMAQNVLNGQENPAPIKRVKKDKGLIERTESSKTVLTEDNKELLND